jgi:hypothetical protein
MGVIIAGQHDPLAGQDMAKVAHEVIASACAGEKHVHGWDVPSDAYKGLGL